MSSKLPPAAIRSLKARLGVLRRPSVWVSGTLLLIGLFALVEYWSQPDRFTKLSSDDRALNLPVLNSDTRPPDLLDPFSTVVDPDEGNRPSSTNAPEGLSEPRADRDRLQLIPPTALAELEGLNRLLIEPIPVSLPEVSDRSVSLPSEIPAASPSYGTRYSVESPLETQRYPEAGLSTVEELPAPGTANPLQAALDRHTAASGAEPPTRPPTAAPVAPAEPSLEPNPVSTPLHLPRSYLPQPLPGQPSGNQTFPQPIYLPQTSPAPGSTGYTVPPALRVPSPAAIGSTDAATPLTPPQRLPGQFPQPATLPTTIQSERFGIAQPQFAQPEPLPFSIPRSTPGRAIGGGQINTFSNP